MLKNIHRFSLLLLSRRVKSHPYFDGGRRRCLSQDMKSNNSNKRKLVEETKIFEVALRKLDEMRRMYTWRGKVIIASFGCILIAGAYVYFFKDEMRDIMVEEVSTVAKRSLEDENLLNKTEQLSKDLVHNLLHDPTLKEQSSKFVLDILSSTETKQAASNLLLSIVKDQKVADEVAGKLKSILVGILHAEETRSVVQEQIEKILHDPSVKSSLQHLISDITHTPEVQNMLSEFFRNILASEAVTTQGSELGRRITTQVISDKTVQEQAGEALWSTLKLSILPKYFHNAEK